MTDQISISVEFASHSRIKDSQYLGLERFAGTRLSQLSHQIAAHLLPLERLHGTVIFEVSSYNRKGVSFDDKQHKRQLEGITDVVRLLVDQVLKR